MKTPGKSTQACGFASYAFQCLDILLVRDYRTQAVQQSRCEVNLKPSRLFLGFIAATIGRLIINVCRKRHIMAPLSGMEYDWAEIRTISLACGLQNTQFAMSSVFSAFYGEEFVDKMHAYS